MDYVAISELNSRPGEVWRRVAAGQAGGLTRRGSPVALIIGLDRSEVEVMRAYRAARLAAAVKRLQDSARASGADRLSDEEIQAEIDAVRSERAARAGSVGT